jgi:hypothetical protein
VHHEHESLWKRLLPKVVPILKRRVESNDGVPRSRIGIQVRPMQNAYKHWRCFCSLYVQLQSLISPSSQVPFFLLPCSNDCILLTLQILNSMKNKNEVKSQKIAKSYVYMLLHQLHIHQWEISIFQPNFNFFNQKIQLQIVYNMINWIF